jgi:hypothetical protein
MAPQGFCIYFFNLIEQMRQGGLRELAKLLEESACGAPIA